MYEENKVFRQPENETEKVWRYMDFTKFVSLLASESLYFTRADKFEDPFEGSYPRRNVMARERAIADEVHSGSVEHILEHLRDFNSRWIKYTAINCWHLNDHESAAMWGLYVKSDEGIAIQTTYQKLRDSFSNVEETIYLGQVEYIDYETEWFEQGNFFAPFVHKRKSFKHETEVRAILIRSPEAQNLEYSQETIDHGVSVPVDLNLLIERIYVSPNAPFWFAELVKSVVEKYGRGFEVIQSNLNQQPLY